MKAAIILAASLVGFGASAADAKLLLNFNDLAHDDKYHTSDFYTSVTESGFKISSALPKGLEVYAQNSVFNADKAGATLTQWSIAPTKVAQVDGKAFNFYSIDLTNVVNAKLPSIVSFAFSDKTFQTVVVPSGGLQTFSFNKKDISWFTMTGPIQFDNLAVPEPATWAMMIAGFGLVGGMMRLSRRADARFTRRVRALGQG